MAGVLSFAWPRFNIGIDYIVRLKNPPEGAAGFVCFLCEENTDDGPSHVASDSHRQRYLGCHFGRFFGAGLLEPGPYLDGITAVVARAADTRRYFVYDYIDFKSRMAEIRLSIVEMQRCNQDDMKFEMDWFLGNGADDDQVPSEFGVFLESIEDSRNNTRGEQIDRGTVEDWQPKEVMVQPPQSP